MFWTCYLKWPWIWPDHDTALQVTGSIYAMFQHEPKLSLTRGHIEMLMTLAAFSPEISLNVKLSLVRYLTFAFFFILSLFVYHMAQYGKCFPTNWISKKKYRINNIKNKQLEMCKILYCRTMTNWSHFYFLTKNMFSFHSSWNVPQRNK